jgi:nucleoside-diphosphate-sugar epimerase
MQLAAEAIAAAYSQETPLRITTARLFTCIGPGFRAHSHLAHVSLLSDALVARRPIRVRSSGRAVRSYLHGADASVWLLAMLTHGVTGAMNVGSDHAITIGDFARLVARVAGRSPDDVEIGGEPDAAPDRAYFVPDITRARRELGLAPWTATEDAVRRTLEHMRSTTTADR